MNNNTISLPSSFAEILEERREETKKFWEGKNLDPVLESLKIALRESQKSRGAYLRFGVYWWALKKVMADHELIPSSWSTDESTIRYDYCGKDELDTIILAFIYRDYYNENLFQGTREFNLNNNGDTHVLFDEDFELSDFLG